MFYTSLHCVNKTSHCEPLQPRTGRNRDPGDEVDVLCVAINTCASKQYSQADEDFCWCSWCFEQIFKDRESFLLM